MIGGSAARTASTSDAVFVRPSENLIEPIECSYGIPIAVMTAEAVCDPELQAEPVDTAIPPASSRPRIISPLRPMNEILDVFGNLNR